MSIVNRTLCFVLACSKLAIAIYNLIKDKRKTTHLTIPSGLIASAINFNEESNPLNISRPADDKCPENLGRITFNWISLKIAVRRGKV